MGKTDPDSGMQTFRGMISPWDQVKGFNETIRFSRHFEAVHAIAYYSALDILCPDVEERSDLIAVVSAKPVEYMLDTTNFTDDPYGMIAQAHEREDIPPFLKRGMYPGAINTDVEDESSLMAGYTWYVDNNRFEKEMRACPFAIVGSDLCDATACFGGLWFGGMGREDMNLYLSERLGEGDPRCLVICESKRKYDDPTYGDQHPWERWGPSTSGMRDPGRSPESDLPDNAYLSTGEFATSFGTTYSAGEMYRLATRAPMSFSSYAATAIRILSDKVGREFAENAVRVVFEASGKMLFADTSARQGVLDWLGVPPDVRDGRILAAYISMIMQAWNRDWGFVEFGKDRSIIEVDKPGLEYLGACPEFDVANEAFFNGMAKTLVGPQWVSRLDPEAPEGRLRFVVERGLYGFRRQKPGYRFTEEEIAARAATEMKEG